MEDGTPLQRHRRARNWTQEQVADQLRQLAGHELGIDANAVSRHERGIIAMPRPPYPELYAELYRTTVATLWPGRMTGMERRRFLQAMAATPLAALLPGADPSAEARGDCRRGGLRPPARCAGHRRLAGWRHPRCIAAGQQPRCHLAASPT
jgi:transcriptional regulator with XRE-family HTH domain